MFNANQEILVYNYILYQKNNLKLGGLIMKTLLTILMVALFGAAVNANPGSNGDYVLTKDGKFVAAKVHLGFFKIHAKSTEGCISEVNYNDVISFKKNGETYFKRPLYNDRKESGMVFMKLISWRNGYSLFCFEDPSLGKDENKRYFMFKDENTFWLEVDSRSAENVKNFFNRVQ